MARWLEAARSTLTGMLIEEDRSDDRPLPTDAMDRAFQSRWLPLLALALAAAGVIVYVAIRGVPGLILLLLGTGISTLFPLVGAFRRPTRSQPLDRPERERMWRASAAANRVVAGFALLGSVAIALSSQFDGWVPTTADDWTVIVLLLVNLSNSLPTLYATYLKPFPDVGG